MTAIVGQLLERLQGGQKIAFLGVGSPLRADDSVGLYIVTELEKCLGTNSAPEYFYFLGESAPENFSGAIRTQNPTHIVIFDAAETGKEPGSFTLIEPEQIGGVSFSTHMLPLKILTDYWMKALDCRIVVIGVQPKLLEFAYSITPEVKQAADGFITEFCSSCK